MAVIPEFVGESNFSRNIVGIIKSVSKSKASVLLEGEMGTGKRLYAQKVHCESACGLKTFFELNCRILKDIEIHYILEKILNTDFTELSKKILLFKETIKINITEIKTDIPPNKIKLKIFPVIIKLFFITNMMK